MPQSSRTMPTISGPIWSIVRVNPTAHNNDAGACQHPLARLPGRDEAGEDCFFRVSGSY